MKPKDLSVNNYIDQLPEDRKEVVSKIRKIILDNIPEGFKETINYGMIGYVVPHEIYPDGYHCNPKLPLPFINLASQKNYIALYHSGIYASQKLLKWFTEEHSKRSNRKLDMGKSCIRFKKMDDIPYDLIQELVSKITVNQWVEMYNEAVKKR